MFLFSSAWRFCVLSLDTLDGESDICLVLPEGEEPLSEFVGVEPIVASMNTYPAYRFYFLRK